VGTKQNVGRLQGSVYNLVQGQNVPLARVVVRANDATAVTDPEGNFLFPSLKPGTYLVRLEQKYIGLDQVTMEKLPLLLQVTQGTVSRVEIHVVRSGNISAKVAIYTPGVRSPSQEPGKQAPSSLLAGEAREGASSVWEEAGGMESGLVEISNGKEMLRQVTDKTGRVRFDHLRPGKWTLRVYENNLPEFHTIENPEAEIGLGPGEQADVPVRVLPRPRAIQFIDKGVIGSDQPH
jgi:hypothetical protein